MRSFHLNSKIQWVTFWDMKKILLVDDDLSVLESLKLLVSSEGHEVVSISDSQRAYTLLEDPDTYDLLVTYLNENTIQRISELGCTAYLDKPFKVQDFLSAIHLALGVPEAS